MSIACFPAEILPHPDWTAEYTIILDGSAIKSKIFSSHAVTTKLAVNATLVINNGNSYIEGLSTHKPLKTANETLIKL